MKRCGKRYGNRRHLVCRRPEGHSGHHAIQLTVRDMEARRKASKSSPAARGDQ